MSTEVVSFPHAGWTSNRVEAGRLIRSLIKYTAFPEFTEEYDLLECFYTHALITRRDAVIMGANIPQVKDGLLCHPLAGPVRIREVSAREDWDANCNTCENLTRLPSKKGHSMRGMCGVNASEVEFHPSDYRGCPSYSRRIRHAT